jgi:N-acetylmuramoyl-L-alanine amidase
MDRRIGLIAVHCTATLAGRPFDVAAIRAMHKAQGWSDIGYHWLIGINGERWEGRPESIAGSHIKGHNAGSIGVCYVGGIGTNGRPADTRTDLQKQELADLLKDKRRQYPRARIRGHRDMSPDKDGDGVVERHEWLKECPCFDVVAWCRTVGVDPL